MEEYKTIVDYPNYEVSNLGNVRNKKTGRILSNNRITDGYSMVDLFNNGKRKSEKIHRLVGMAFIDNPDKKDCIDHIDNNRLNNNVSNLRWASKKENCQNRSISKRNTSGIKGVSFDKKANKWRAQIKIDGINIHLGSYNTKEEAKVIRVQRANEAFGVFTNSCEKQ